MSDECLHFCADDLAFPKRPANRPALDRIDYRIGAYADFRAAMLRHSAGLPCHCVRYTAGACPGRREIPRQRLDSNR